MKKSLKITVSELILSAVYFLQKKNGVSAKDITKYICQKRGLKQSQMKHKVREALNRGTQNGIFNMKRGLYKVQGDYKQKLTHLNRRTKRTTSVMRSKRKLIKNKSSKDQAKLAERQEKKVSNRELETMKKPESKLVFEKSRSLSEVSPEPNGRENSYFEPASIAKDSDDDEFLEDDEDDDEDEDYSDSNDDLENCPKNVEAGKKQYSYAKVCNHPPRPKRRKLTPKGNHRNASTNRQSQKNDRLKSCKTRRKMKNPNSRGKQGDTDDSDEADDDSDNWTESDNEKSKKDKNKRPTAHKWKGHEQKQKEGEKAEGNNEEKKECREDKRKGKDQMSEQRGGKYKTRKADNSSDSDSDEEDKDSQKNSKKDEDSEKLKKSEAELTSSSKLLSGDLKLSLSSNINVSDVKLTPTKLKFDKQDSTTVLFSEKQKKLQQQRQHQQQQEQKNTEGNEESMKEVDYYCECKNYRRKNRRTFCSRDKRSPVRDGESTQRRLKPRRSHK